MSKDKTTGIIIKLASRGRGQRSQAQLLSLGEPGNEARVKLPTLDSVHE